jgi:hypothetical protein
MTIQLVFVASPLGTQHNGVRTLEDSIIRCQDGVTYLHVGCNFTELAYHIKMVCSRNVNDKVFFQFHANGSFKNLLGRVTTNKLRLYKKCSKTITSDA